MDGRARLVVATIILVGVWYPLSYAAREEPPVSDATQDCIACHIETHPGIVADWRRSRHSRTTPAEALKKPKLQRRVSAKTIPENLSTVVVGCAECHTLNPASHKDTFTHNDQKVHVVVSPRDCSTCHPDEADQFRENLMSYARVNLVDNKLYQTLVKSVNGVQTFKDMKTSIAGPDAMTNAASCYHCHGTAVEVKGTEKRDTDQGEMEFPVLTGWPNQGVGRFNTDGSRGSCSACHTRHQFPIEMARKPYTCSQCHKGPDVPAYKAYMVSKHGNLFSSLKGEWNFQQVPWTLGTDFSAPTCAVCHISLLVDGEGTVIEERTHRMNNRLPWRILGLIYAHPQPKSPNTSIIRNADGQPLPTTLNGKPATKYLIGPKEMETRRKTLQKVCRACHGEDWVNGHWARLENTIKTTDEMTRTATEIVSKAWDEGLADRKNGLFDEAIEKQWVEEWLFYANSTRFAAAMMGADYGVFANGRWFLSNNIQDMLDRLRFLKAIKKGSP
ncbi:MAG: multiheme c-type cytochrome [Deltaproteobacteria bacterium]